jgi:hypothetical protein
MDQIVLAKSNSIKHTETSYSARIGIYFRYLALMHRVSNLWDSAQIY